MSCNVSCDKGANPYGLMLYRWYERNTSKGFPSRASLVMPLEPENVWQRVLEKLPPDEWATLEEWKNIERASIKDVALFAGCNLQIFPYLAHPSIIGDIPIFGRPDLCCGEVYYRVGALGRVEKIAQRLAKIYSELPINQLVFYCQAGYNMLKNILPTYFGASFPFQITYLGDELHRKVMSGELDVKGKLAGLRVTLHDPCHSKVLGKDFQSKPREILEHMGCHVIEMEHNRSYARCCGLGNGAARFNPIDIALGCAKRLLEARKTGVDRLVTYCNTCFLLFSIGSELAPFGVEPYHLNELVLEALGAEYERRNLSRGRLMLKELLLGGFPTVLSPKRFQLDDFKQV